MRPRRDRRGLDPSPRSDPSFRFQPCSSGTCCSPTRLATQLPLRPVLGQLAQPRLTPADRSGLRHKGPPRQVGRHMWVTDTPYGRTTTVCPERPVPLPLR